MNSTHKGIRDPKLFIAALSVAIGLSVFLFVPRIPQNPEYHQFADQRKLLGIPNFWDVVTNLPFIVIGIIGLRRLTKNDLPGFLIGLKMAYSTFFSGLILIGLGSVYYHLHPVNETLVWDRLSITVSFMAFFVIVYGESVSVRTARMMLAPLVGLGIASVIYWHITESQGVGDLRLYGLVQFFPMLLIPFMLFWYGSVLSPISWFFGILGAYATAKAAEMYDHQIYELLGFSGHSLKHLLAALGAYLFLLSLGYRKKMDGMELNSSVNDKRGNEP